MTPALDADTTPGIHIREHSTKEEFARLEPIWNDLVLQSPSPSLYMSFEWLFTWWECLGGGRRSLRILSVEDGTRTIGLAPFMEVRCRFLGIPHSRIEFISAREYAFSHLTMAGTLDIIAPRRADDVADAILRHLLASRTSWTYLRFEPLSSEGSAAEKLVEAARRLGLTTFPGSFATAYEVSFDHNLEDPESQGFPVREEGADRLEQRLRKHYEVSWHDAEGSIDAASQFARLLDIERRSWKWNHGLSINALGYGGFFERFMKAAATKGELLVTQLSADGLPIVYIYSVGFAGTLEALKTAYDSSYARFSPGRVAWWHHLRRARDRGFRKVNLNIGSEEYKAEFYTHARRYEEVFVLRNTARARITGFLLFTLRLYGKFRVFPDLTKRILRRLGFTPRWSELTRMDQA